MRKKNIGNQWINYKENIMDNFNFYSPTEFVFGKGRESECGKYVKKNGEFVKLTKDDAAEIYRIALNAEV